MKKLKKTLRPFINVARIFRSWLIQVFSPLMVPILFKDIWELKKSYLKAPSGFKKVLYYAYLEHYGSWIGINSIIIKPPVLPHGFWGIFISDKATIEEGVVIFHQVTIGSNTILGSKSYGSPHLEKNVYIGAGAKIIGGVTVGANTRVGANAIIHTDIPVNSLVILNCTKIIQRDTLQDNMHIPINQ